MIERVAVPMELVMRILNAFIYMVEHGATCPDRRLMEDLDQVIASHERRHP
jgi:hypothetical protein